MMRFVASRVSLRCFNCSGRTLPGAPLIYWKKVPGLEYKFKYQTDHRLRMNLDGLRVFAHTLNIDSVNGILETGPLTTFTECLISLFSCGFSSGDKSFFCIGRFCRARADV